VKNIVISDAKLFTLRTFWTIQKHGHTVIFAIERLWLLKLMTFENPNFSTHCNCSYTGFEAYSLGLE
jgi:hypothetical protein